MQQIAAAPSAQILTAESPLTPESWGKLGMWVFLAADAMTFGGLLAGYTALRLNSPNWPVPSHTLSLGMTGAMTLLLLLSSLWLETALAAGKQGNNRRLRKFLALTIAGGAGFLALQGYEWNHLIHRGLTLTENAWGSGLFGATFYVLTGFHGGHVLAGVIYLTWTLLRTSVGRRGPEHSSALALAGLYWHFVYLVWIFIFTLVYLL